MKRGSKAKQSRARVKPVKRVSKAKQSRARVKPVKRVSKAKQSRARVKPGTRGKAGVARVYRKLRFGSAKSVERSLGAARLGRNAIGSLLDTASSDSPARLNQLATAIVSQRRRIDEERVTLRNLVGWAARSSGDAVARRRTIARAYKAKGRGLFFIHGLSELSPGDAALFMKSYFDEGGDMATLAEWLSIAGAAVKPTAIIGVRPPTVVGGIVVRARRRPRPRVVARPRLFGWVSDAASAVGNWFSEGYDAVTNAISTVADAIAAAARDLGAAIAAAASWTLSKTVDLVKGLIAAGRSAASILGQALAEGLLTKFVQALMQAGRAIGDVLNWAVQKAASVIRDAVSALLSIGRTIFQVLDWAKNLATSVVQKVVKGLIDAGRTVAQIMTDVVRFMATAIEAARKFVGAVYAVVQKVGQILVTVVTNTPAAIRMVLEGLLMAGVNLARVVESVCLDVVEGFRKGFIEGLIAIGRGAIEIVTAVLASGAAVILLTLSAILKVFGGHRKLTDDEKAEARKVFGWSINLERVEIAVASLPADFINWANGGRPFTSMYIINFASWATVTKGTLIHELTHVWQAVQSGPIYMVEALHSQFFGRGYEVTPEDIANAQGKLTNLEREQQAVVVERYWKWKFAGGSVDRSLYEPLAKQVYRAKLGILPVTLLQPFGIPVNRRIARPRRFVIA